MRLFIVFSFIFLTIQAIAQDSKNEKESKVRKEELPSGVLESLDSYLSSAKKVKFFSESDNDKKSYEVKLIYKGKKCSIEFDLLGKLEDVEIKISNDVLSIETMYEIKQHMNGFEKYRIDKLQKQYSSDTMSNQEIIKNALDYNEGDIIRYEMEVDVKQNGKWIAYEMLFSDAGNFILQRKIIHRSSDFILY